MNLREQILGAINTVCRLRRMELRPMLPLEVDSSLAAALRRAATFAPNIQSIIDVGAAAGTWTARALPHFPNARYSLIEPLRERQAELEALQAAHPSVEIVFAAAGERMGEAILSISAMISTAAGSMG